MLRELLLSGVAALTVGTLVAVVPFHDDAVSTEPVAASADSAQVQIYGPYATMRRANEVASELRTLGFNALAYHNGDGYYVKAW